VFGNVVRGKNPGWGTGIRPLVQISLRRFAPRAIWLLARLLRYAQSDILIPVQTKVPANLS